MMQQIKRLRLIMVVFLMTNTYSSLFSQVIDNKQYNYIGNWYNWQGGRFTTNLNLPKVRATTGRDTGAIHYRIADSSIYLWTGSQWRQVTGGGGGGAADSSIFATRYYTGQNFVPYTGAINDVDLGAFNFAARSINVTGTSGNGHIHLRHQSSLPNATGQSTAIYADNDGNIGYKNDGFNRVTFNTRFNTEDRIYRFQNKSYTVADSADVALKLNISDTASMLSPYLRSNVAAATYVPQSRTITINGTALDLSADRSWTVSGTNIYNSNGTLTGNRFLDLGTTNTLSFGKGANTNFHLFNNGNAWFGNGTPADGGFRLDVNGSARIRTSASSYFTIASSVASSINSYLGLTTTTSSFGEGEYSLGANLRNNGTSFIRDNNGIGAWMISQFCGNDISNHFFRIRTINPNTGILNSSAFVIRGDGIIGINREPVSGVGLSANGFVGTSNGIIIDQSVNRYSLGLVTANSNTGLQLSLHDNPNPALYILNGTNNSITFNSRTVYPSAQIAIDATNKGFLPPRMTADQASAIASPAEGLMVYVTNTNGTFTSKGWWGWSGAAWEKLNN